MFDELKEIIASYNVKYFNPNYAGLFRGCFGVGGIKLPFLSRKGNLKTWNLVRKYTHTHLVSENILYLLVPWPPLILLMSTFFCEKSENIPVSIKTFSILMVPTFVFPKKSVFSGRNSTFTQSNSTRAVLEIV